MYLVKPRWRRGGTSAGGEDVLRREPRFRVGGRQDVVVAVAVVAGGDFGGDVRLAERHGLAVVGVVVVLQAVRVALAAALVAGLLEVGVAVRLDLVGGVAVGADRAVGSPSSRSWPWTLLL